jgi:hypothetical protein
MPQALTALLTLVTGELLLTALVQVIPASTPLIQSCWKVAWAEADATRLASAAEVRKRRILVNWEDHSNTTGSPVSSLCRFLEEAWG